MTPKTNADDGERIAADDVVFEKGLIPPLPAAPAPPPSAAAVPVVEGRASSPGDNPLRDPLLELEQEFQDQEEEGKV